MRNHSPILLIPACIIYLISSSVPSTSAWGDEGHRWINRIAAESLPPDVPEFFRGSVARLEFLGPEPDRWRDNRELFKALGEVNSPDHWTRRPAGALKTATRNRNDSLRRGWPRALRCLRTCGTRPGRIRPMARRRPDELKPCSCLWKKNTKNRQKHFLASFKVLAEVLKPEHGLER